MSAASGQQPPNKRHGCVTALMIVGGLVLVLPGVCVVLTAIPTIPALIASFFGQRPADPYFWTYVAGWVVFWAICIGISCLGIWLIIRAAK